MRLSVPAPVFHPGIACLHHDRAAHRIDDAGKFHQQAVARSLDEATAVLGDLRIEELAAQRFETFERAFLIHAHQPRIPRHIGGEDRGKAAGLAHCVSPAARRRPDSSSSRSSRLRKQIVRHEQQRYGAQPGDDRARFIEPPHMDVARRENAV